MIKFPLTELLDEQACYDWLLKILHPGGLHCPNGHALPDRQAPHDRKRTPIVKYKCRECGKVFHIFTGTDLCGSHYNCGTIVLLLRGFLQGQTTQHIAEELGLDYRTVLAWRHRIQGRGFAHLINTAIPDQESEMDEMFQNAGEKEPNTTRLPTHRDDEAINAKARARWQMTVHPLSAPLDAAVVRSV
ncbi:helix-turn-helix domain-containing protein [Pseudanabaena sp. PCC 6802]|uniref:helix-turn-helix domain-containing protein n=1 Tax=Pseudanabaena sp. PCC 6802 TaxID=118173 RepID=UPI00047644D2|nr:helix-turn-helix domain-containing protein [Pseudanabaena sp. PCC 6802]